MILNINNNSGKKTNINDEENNHAESHIQLNLGNTKIQTNDNNEKHGKNF